MISNDDLNAARHIVHTSGMVALISDGVGRDTRGRKANLAALELLCVGSLLTVHTRRSATVEDIYRVLTGDLDLYQQQGIGVRDRHGNLTITLPQLRRWTTRIRDDLNYGPSMNIPDVERARREAVMRSLAEAVMDVFQTEFTWDTTTYALDATAIWSWGIHRRKKAENAADATAGAETADIGSLPNGTGTDSPPDDEDALTPDDAPDGVLVVGERGCHDPDARVGAKTGKNGKTQWFYGYEEHTLVQVPGTNNPADAVPALIKRFEVLPASYDIVDPSLRIIDAARNVEAVLADKHYHYKEVHRWRDELVARGITQVHDLRDDEHGAIWVNGVPYIDGWPHCPGTPPELYVIKRPAPNASNEEKQQFRDLIDQRYAYALQRNTSLDLDGRARYACPAVSGRLGCPLWPDTERVARAALMVIVEPPATGPSGHRPKCCTQQSVTLTLRAGKHAPTGHADTMDKARKLAQHYYWGSRDWERLYRQRTFVEGSYGNRKNASTENLSRGLTRIVGLSWTQFTLTMVNASYNLRILRNWAERHPGAIPPDHPLIATTPGPVGYVPIAVEDFDRFIAAAAAAASDVIAA